MEDTQDNISPVNEVSNNHHAEDTTNNAECGSEVSMVILSVFWHKRLLGAAFYVAEAAEIHVVPDIVDMEPDFQLLHSLYSISQPSHLLTTGQVPEMFITTLKSLVNCNSQSVSSEKKNAELHIMPRKEYNFEACRRRAFLLELPGEPENCTEDEHLLYLQGLIKTTAESMMHALGALLKWLDSSLREYVLVREDTAIPVASITTMSLENLVMIDSEACEELQIFTPQMHPSNFKQGMPGNNLEGLSLFGILNRCKSKVGSLHLRLMLLQPTNNIDILNERLDVVQFCCDPKNSDVVKTLMSFLRYTRNVSKIVRKLLKLTASLSEWKCLYKTIFYFILTGDLCGKYASSAKLFRKMAKCIDEELHKMAFCISSVIDFDASDNQNIFCVKLGFDEQLDRLKQKHGGLTEFMSKAAEDELKQLPPYVQKCSIIYLPELGYLLSIPSWKDNLTVEETKIPGLEYKFWINGTVNYKSARCYELDRVLGDVVVEISTRESEILLHLAQVVQENITSLNNMMKMSAELDCLIALAAAAQEYNYTRPVLTEEKVLEIKQGRHPLQELHVDSFVPNDTFSSEKHSLVKILTGPNASGKSVYLKQVALIAYLAHIGSFVPAQSAKIGLLDKILTRIQTKESVSTNISAYVNDAKQVSACMCNSTPYSLVIIDEFGKGTAEIDGMAMLASCLENFLSRKGHSPHVFVSTHYHRIVSLIGELAGIKFQKMDYLIEENERIVYLFKLAEGSVHSSSAYIVTQSELASSILSSRIPNVLETMFGNHLLKPIKDSIETMRKKALDYISKNLSPEDTSAVSNMFANASSS